ncbi:RecB family exonuclease [Bathymodiolus brooksi thiotrophic gill symbiont]|nr:RecB family exonuclease [Bathymodiolus brooksi thiotrophic gill symbiont]
MWINANTSNIDQDDTIILANNRQVLAFKKTWGIQKGNSALPRSLSWHQYLQETWRILQPNSEKRLISNNESRALIERSMLKSGQTKIDSRLLDEVIKNNDYCQAHLIEYAQLSQTGIQNYELFVTWMQNYQQSKLSNNLLDANDLPALLVKQSAKLTKPYIYGFKTLTPVQVLLLDKIGYQTLEEEQKKPHSNNQIFQTSYDEIGSAAKWAKDLNTQYPDKHIAIVCPTLNRQHHQIKSIFDQVFTDMLVETGQKSYNISLGLPLNDYPLIRHLLAILKLCEQLQGNRIDTEVFNAVVTSPYITYAQEEQSARALLVNRVLFFSKTCFKFSHLEKHLDIAPQIKTILETIITQASKKRQTHDQWLLLFDNYLQIWGFATDRTLSSTEYQLFNKYQTARSELNQLAQFGEKINMADALLDLKKWLSQVIFQAQSAKTPIQILGSLEAEGLVFDNAWVLGMTDGFLPVALNSPRFIPSDIAQKHQIPHSSFALIVKDAQDTFNNLIGLSDTVIFSYAKTHFESEQQPSPLLKFNNETQAFKYEYQNVALELLSDDQANPLLDTQVNNGVNILKDQMACEFKGFTHRLNTQAFNNPHIGLNRMEQGNIIHLVLQYFYQEITTQEELLSLSNDALDALIQQKIISALKYYEESGFKKIEKIRILRLIRQFIEIDKLRGAFTVLSTEEKIKTNIAGLEFTTRLDRLDEMSNGDKIIFDYKTGKSIVSHWCGQAIKEPQLPIYAISKDTQGIAFIQLNADQVSIKGLSKDEESLPRQRPTRLCAKWDEQIDIWKILLNTASENFQSGIASVLPNPNACNYCDFDALCRVKK